MMDFITETMKNFNVPIIALYYNKEIIYDIDDEKVWTKDKIYQCIENNEAGLNLSSNYSL